MFVFVFGLSWVRSCFWCRKLFIWYSLFCCGLQELFRLVVFLFVFFLLFESLIVANESGIMGAAQAKVITENVEICKGLETYTPPCCWCRDVSIRNHSEPMLWKYMQRWSLIWRYWALQFSFVYCLGFRTSILVPENLKCLVILSLENQSVHIFAVCMFLFSSQPCGIRFFGHIVINTLLNVPVSSEYPSKIEWDRIQTDPAVSCDPAIK